MPEGDTIYRTAATIDRWMTGRQVTAARTTVDRLSASKLVGETITGVEARAKHLLIRFSGGSVLHTHMKMTGSWHLYTVTDRWQKPATQARFVLEAGDRIAVCFNAPVVELLAARGEDQHPGLVNLGPDVLKPPVDLEEVRRRAATRPPALPIGELLLDQQVVSGIGNIWRCESLFQRRLDPWLPQSQLPESAFDALVTTASELMLQRIGDTGEAGRMWVYGRGRRPCYRCRTSIRSAKLGSQPRTVYWCPTCQSRAGVGSASEQPE